MTVRETIGFDNNPQAMEMLREQYRERRTIDRELDIQCTVQFFQAAFAGDDSGRMYIEYDYEDLGAVERAWGKRLTHERWAELGEDLAAVGFKPSYRAIAINATPD